MGANILITGVPRAGTTLTTELLGGLPDCVAVDEPMDVGRLLHDAERPRRGARHLLALSRRRPTPTLDRDQIVSNVLEFCRESRESILRDGTVISKQVKGEVKGAKVSDELTPDAKRTRLARRDVIRIEKPLTHEFSFFVKHNSAFSGILSELGTQFDIFAVVRNPVAILASWNSVPFSVSKGHASLAERLNPALREQLAMKPELFDRQLHLLDWFFRQFVEHLGERRVVRYEDIVSSQGTALSTIHPAATQMRANLTSRNQTRWGDAMLTSVLADRLINFRGHYWSFYDRQEILSLTPA